MEAHDLGDDTGKKLLTNQEQDRWTYTLTCDLLDTACSPVYFRSDRNPSSSTTLRLIQQGENFQASMCMEVHGTLSKAMPSSHRVTGNAAQRTGKRRKQGNGEGAAVGIIKKQEQK